MDALKGSQNSWIGKLMEMTSGGNYDWLGSLMACWRRLHLQFRHRWTSGRTSKSSNGRKIARMARNSTIFGPNESSRRDLFLSKSWNNRKVFEKLRKIFENFFEHFFERCNLMGDVILSKTSLIRGVREWSSQEMVPAAQHRPSPALALLLDLCQYPWRT